jgi:putative endonuclease
MKFYVYLLISNFKNKHISYVGYTSNIEKRVKLHNISKGAKFTKGKKWKLIYSKKYLSKSKALKEEYKLKKNYKLRKTIKDKYIYN